MRSGARSSQVSASCAALATAGIAAGCFHLGCGSKCDAYAMISVDVDVGAIADKACTLAISGPTTTATFDVPAWCTGDCPANVDTVRGGEQKVVQCPREGTGELPSICERTASAIDWEADGDYAQKLFDELGTTSPAFAVVCAGVAVPAQAISGHSETEICPL